MARFFGTAEKSPKNRHVFCKILILAQLFFAKPFEMENFVSIIAFDCENHQEEYSIHISFQSRACSIYENLLSTGEITVAECRVYGNACYKNSGQRIFMFLSSLCLGHFADFRKIEAKIWAFFLDFGNSCLSRA